MSIANSIVRIVIGILGSLCVAYVMLGLWVVMGFRWDTSEEFESVLSFDIQIGTVALAAIVLFAIVLFGFSTRRLLVATLLAAAAGTFLTVSLREYHLDVHRARSGE